MKMLYCRCLKANRLIVRSDATLSRRQTNFRFRQLRLLPLHRRLSSKMAAARTLTSLLPEPKYHNDSHQQTMALQQEPDGSPSDTRLVAKKTSGAPPYGHRSGWMPRTLDDFGDGGAFPEINIAQYPLEMGKKKSVSPPPSQTFKHS